MGPYFLRHLVRDAQPPAPGMRGSLVLLMLGLIVAWFLVSLILIGIGCFGTFLLIAGLAAVVWWKGREQSLREQRSASGLCDRCGYDLRSSVDRCPECGTPLPEDLVRRRRVWDELQARRGSNVIKR